MKATWSIMLGLTVEALHLLIGWSWPGCWSLRVLWASACSSSECYGEWRVGPAGLLQPLNCVMYLEVLCRLEIVIWCKTEALWLSRRGSSFRERDIHFFFFFIEKRDSTCWFRAGNWWESSSYLRGACEGLTLEWQSGEDQKIRFLTSHSSIMSVKSQASLNSWCQQRKEGKTCFCVYGLLRPRPSSFAGHQSRLEGLSPERWVLPCQSVWFTWSGWELHF